MPSLEIEYKWNHISMWSSLTSCFHLASCLQGTPVLCHISFLFGYYVYTTCCLSISWGTVGLFPLWVIMKNAAMNVCGKFSPRHLFSNVYILDIYLGDKSLSHRVTLKFVCSRNCQTVFQSSCSTIHSHHSFPFSGVGSNFSTSSPTLLFVCFVFITVILVDLRWYSILILWY